MASVTNNASCSEAIPAATTGSTATWARSASSVTKASCSTWARRPNARWGVSPRYHNAVQAAASSWPSQASRPYTLTSSERPSGAWAVTIATPRGSSGAWRSPLASTSRSARASATWARVRRPAGEPNSRWTMAADPIPTAKAATIPMGTAVSNAMAASAPTPTTTRPT